MSIVKTKTLTVKSPVFEERGLIPALYTCDGLNINPPLVIGDIPHETQSLALIVDDPDAPHGTFVHWIMWNIPPTALIDENSAPGREGKNGLMKNRYFGPCPQSGAHHYHFKVYALDAMLDLRDNTGKGELLRAMDGHVLAEGELTGIYQR